MHRHDMGRSGRLTTGLHHARRLTRVAAACALSLAGVLAAPAAWAATTAADGAEAEAVKQRFEARFDGLKATAVNPTPYGLYEVQLDDELVYVDPEVNFVLNGSLIDAKTREDVTKARKEVLSAINFSDLPTELSIRQVKGDGSRQVAIFEDPNCGYCKALRKTLEEVDNLTIHTFLLPILGPDSITKATNVWCAKDQGKVWDEWMLKGRTPAQASCDAPLQDWTALARTLNIRGTPAVFFEDGTRVAGAMPLDMFNSRLERASQAAR